MLNNTAYYFIDSLGFTHLSTEDTPALAYTDIMYRNTTIENPLDMIIDYDQLTSKAKELGATKILRIS